MEQQMENQIMEYINNEKINSKFLLKRLSKESEKFSERFKSISLVYQNKKYLLYMEDKINYKYNKYCFILNENYPFSPPMLEINNIPYKQFLISKTQKYNKLMKQMSGLECMCCNNILCNDRWSPAITITKIVDEINIFRNYKKNIIYKIMIDKIKDKYLIFDIDLDSWLFQ